MPRTLLLVRLRLGLYGEKTSREARREVKDISRVTSACGADRLEYRPRDSTYDIRDTSQGSSDRIEIGIKSTSTYAGVSWLVEALSESSQTMFKVHVRAPVTGSRFVSKPAAQAHVLVGTLSI